MSDYTIEVKDVTPTVMVRRDASGALIEQEARRDEYIVPPSGEYRLRLTGFSKPFEMTTDFGTSMKTRLEFEIVSERGRGKRFTDLYTWTIGRKSNLGKLIRKARGLQEFAKGSVDVAELLLPTPAVELVASVATSDATDDAGRPKYASIALDTVRPASAAKAPAYDPFAA